MEMSERTGRHGRGTNTGKGMGEGNGTGRRGENMTGLAPIEGEAEVKEDMTIKTI
jgi:hypothetical protein